MSAGRYIRSTYQTDGGQIVPIRVQPETIAAFNAAPVGALSAGFPSAKVSKTRREIGIGARHVTLKWVGDVPSGYEPTGVLRVPVLTTAAYNAIALNSTVTYLGSSAVVISKTPESIK